jgi:hypothetical protein
MNDTTTLTAPEKLVRMPDTGMLIGAHRVAAGDGRTIEVEDPATGKIIAHVPAGGTHEVDAAVTAARTAFESRAWSRMRPLDRARIIETIARKIEEMPPNWRSLKAMTTARPFIMRSPWMSLPRLTSSAGRMGFEDRRSGQSDLGRWPSVSLLFGARAHWRGRPDRPLELPARHGGLEDRNRTGGRMHDCSQAL